MPGNRVVTSQTNLYLPHFQPHSSKPTRQPRRILELWRTAVPGRALRDLPKTEP